MKWASLATHSARVMRRLAHIERSPAIPDELTTFGERWKMFGQQTALFDAFLATDYVALDHRGETTIRVG